jgi:hypothetical protein
MVDGAVVDAANARTNERKEARMHEEFVKFAKGSVETTHKVRLVSPRGNPLLAAAPPRSFRTVLKVQFL